MTFLTKRGKMTPLTPGTRDWGHLHRHPAPRNPPPLAVRPAVHGGTAAQHTTPNSYSGGWVLWSVPRYTEVLRHSIPLQTTIVAAGVLWSVPRYTDVLRHSISLQTAIVATGVLWSVPRYTEVLRHSIPLQTAIVAAGVLWSVPRYTEVLRHSIKTHSRSFRCSVEPGRNTWESTEGLLKGK